MCYRSTNDILVNYFNSIDIFFPKPHTIEYRSPSMILQQDTEIYLNRFQLSVARIATGLTQQEFANHLGFADSSITSLEQNPNHKQLKLRKVDSEELKIFFEKIGIVFEKKNQVLITKDPSIFFKQKP